MIISTRAIDLIIAKEVTTQKHYEQKLTGIIVPAGDSGATIGIGYDLGHQTPEQIARDWKGEVSPNTISILQMFAGLKGDKAKRAVQQNMISKQVGIPYNAARNVFIRKSLPQYARRALTIYPGLDKLYPDAIGGIVSMVYNRGTKLHGDSRTEMRNIVPMVIVKDYAGIANEIEKSKRLWLGKKGVEGLLTRREEEAALVRNSNRQYTNADLVDL